MSNTENIPTKVHQYEKFVNEVLRKDLETTLQARDKIYSQIAEYLQLKTVIEKLKESATSESGIKTKVDLGCNFYVQANVPDASKIFVSVGFGFFVEFSHSEALKFIGKKVDHLTHKTNQLTKESAKIKAHIKLVYEGLRELQDLQGEQPNEYKEIW